MTTVSISLDNELKKELDAIAKTSGVSRSDAIRQMIRYRAWEQRREKIAVIMQAKFDELGLETYDDIEKFLG